MVWSLLKPQATLRELCEVAEGDLQRLDTGFFGAVVLLLLNVFRKWLYAALVPYTLAHIGGWLAQGMPNFRLGVFDKTVQVLLIVLLAYLFVQEHRAEKAG